MNRFIVLPVLGAILLSACKQETAPAVAEQYPVVSPERHDTTYASEYVAEIIAVQNVEIRNRLHGFIEVIHVDEGKPVKKGQTLFSISSKVYQQKLLQAEAATKSALADLKSAQIELENTERLYKKNIISKTEFELAQARAEALKAKVEEARSQEAEAHLQLSFTEIKAPFDGIINRIPKKVGSLVEEGELLTSISNHDEVLAYFHLSEKEYLEYRKRTESGKSDKVSLMLADGSPFPHPGVIETSESEFDPLSGNIAFRARFANPEGILRHGSHGKVVISKPLNNALMIPQKSTFEIQDKTYVYVVKSDSTLEQRIIVLKQRLPHIFVVESGITENDHILYEGVESVSNGLKINPVLIEKRKVQAFNSRRQ